MLTTSQRRRLFVLAFVGLSFLSAAAARAQLLAPNLIYNSIKPCRIIDTRLAGGPLAAGVNRTFNVVGVTAAGSLASQGGNASGCPIPGFSVGGAAVQAVAVNLVAVASSGAGDLVAWPTDQTQPTASVINYVNSASLGFLNIANGIILPVRQDTQGNDITVKAQVSGTGLVADVVGYFSSSSGGTLNLFLGTMAGNPSVTTSVGNSAFGVAALAASTSGQQNTAFGEAAMNSTTSGGFNAGFGYQCLSSNTSGMFNTALGNGALGNLMTGNWNLGVGNGAGVNYVGSETSNVLIVNAGVAAESNTIRIGTQGTGNQQQNQTFIAGINGATSTSGTAVFVNAAGQLGTTTSSRRFKEDIEAMGESSQGLMRLRPVTFHYKPAYDDGSRLLQYGLIAEEVAEVYPELVQYDEAGQPLAVRYHFVNAMLLNEVQRLHKQIEELQAQVAGIDALRARLAQQEERLRKLEAKDR